MKNILIIGGSYFAGRVLVENLIREGNYNIFVYNRGRVPLRLKEVTEIVGDRDDEARIRHAIPEKNWHGLVDFCAYTPDHIDKIIRSLPGTLNHYIYISTTTVYKNIWNLPIREESPKLSGIQPELGPYADYGYNKWLAEMKLNQVCEKRNIAFTSLRPSIIYGKYNYAPRESYFFDLIRDDKPVIIPDNELALFSFVWVEDVAKIIMGCIGNEKTFNQALNVSAEELVSYRRLVEVLEEISDKKLNIKKMKIRDIDAQKIPLPFPLDAHLVYSGSKIKQLLQFDYTPFVDGMKKTYEYYQWLLERKQKLSD